MYEKIQSKLYATTTAAELGKREKFDNLKIIDSLRQDIAENKKAYPFIKSKLLSPTRAHIHGSRSKVDKSDPREIGWNMPGSANDRNDSSASVDETADGNPRIYTSKSKYKDVSSKLLALTKGLILASRDKADDTDPRERGWNSSNNFPVGEVGSRAEFLFKRRNSYDSAFVNVKSKLLTPTTAVLLQTRQKVELSPRPTFIQEKKNGFFSEPDENEEYTGHPNLFRHKSVQHVQAKLYDSTVAAKLKVRDKTPSRDERELGWNSRTTSRNSLSNITHGRTRVSSVSDNGEEEVDEGEIGRKYSSRLYRPKDFGSFHARLSAPPTDAAQREGIEVREVVIPHLASRSSHPTVSAGYGYEVQTIANQSHCGSSLQGLHSLDTIHLESDTESDEDKKADRDLSVTLTGNVSKSSGIVTGDWDHPPASVTDMCGRLMDLPYLTDPGSGLKQTGERTGPIYFSKAEGQASEGKVIAVGVGSERDTSAGQEALDRLERINKLKARAAEYDDYPRSSSLSVDSPTADS